MTEKHEEPTLLESPTQFELAFERTAVGMGMLRLDGRWVMVNPALCKLLGYERAELLQMDVKSLTHPEDVAETVRLMGEISKGNISSYQ